MNPIFLLISTALIVAQLVLPRRLAFAPLLIASFHLGNAEIAGNFTTIQLLILVGLGRAYVKGFFEFSFRVINTKIMVFMCAYILFSSFFHSSQGGNPLISRIGIVLNIMGVYLYARAYIKDMENYTSFAKTLCYILLPLAVFMMLENQSRKNSYALLGASSLNANVRDGRVRAQGPFAHAILAGTAGASSFPIIFALWRRNKKFAKVGFISCFAITFASSSSGPLATFMVGVGALYLWRWRERLKTIKVLTVLMIIVLSLGMMKPPWYLMAKIDLVGGSTGWHRAKLIDRAWDFIGDWWFIGTDYTRHWMASGVQWSDQHVDLTNYYLHLGVMAGFPTIIFLVLLMTKSFKYLGRRIREMDYANDPNALVLWTIGSAIFAHAITFTSVSYFDQMFVPFYFLLGAVPALTSGEYVPAEEDVIDAEFTEDEQEQYV